MQEGAVSVCMKGTDSERLSATLEDEDVRTPSRSSKLCTTDRGRELPTERHELVVRLNEYKVSKEHLEG